jgi:hypothetical protein
MINYSHKFAHVLLLYLAQENDGVIPYDDVVDKLVYFTHIWGNCSDQMCSLHSMHYDTIRDALYWLLCNSIDLPMDCGTVSNIVSFIQRHNQVPANALHLLSDY